MRIYLLHAAVPEDRLYNGFDTRGNGLLISCALALGRIPGLVTWAGRLWLVSALILASIFLYVPWSALQKLTSRCSPARLSAYFLLLVRNKPGTGLAAGATTGSLYGANFLWRVFVALADFERSLGQPFQKRPRMAALAAGSTLLCASLSFHFVERPLLRPKEMIGHTATRGAPHAELAPKIYRPDPEGDPS